jgi:hypothetical protein
LILAKTSTYNSLFYINVISFSQSSSNILLMLNFDQRADSIALLVALDLTTWATTTASMFKFKKLAICFFDEFKKLANYCIYYHWWNGWIEFNNIFWYNEFNVLALSYIINQWVFSLSLLQVWSYSTAQLEFNTMFCDCKSCLFQYQFNLPLFLVEIRVTSSWKFLIN